MRRALLIYRNRLFSPNSIDADKAIIDEVGTLLTVNGIDTTYMSEDDVNLLSNDLSPDDVIFSMARSNRALEWMMEVQKTGVRIINSPNAVRACQRSRLFALLKEQNVSVPPEKGDKGVWVKRGDEAAQCKNDVVYCKNDDELATIIDDFDRRRISDRITQAHIEGDIVKFYGVNNSPFFKFFYPTDNDFSKYNLEIINGKAHHYPFRLSEFQSECVRICNLTGIDIYGGDAIITSSGEWFFIDFNDWPSFRSCRTEAARAIADLVI